MHAREPFNLECNDHPDPDHKPARSQACEALRRTRPTAKKQLLFLAENDSEPSNTPVSRSDVDNLIERFTG